MREYVIRINVKMLISSKNIHISYRDIYAHYIFNHVQIHMYVYIVYVYV